MMCLMKFIKENDLLIVSRLESRSKYTYDDRSSYKRKEKNETSNLYQSLNRREAK